MEYPDFFKAADAASRNAQAKFLILFRLNLLFVFLSTIAGAFHISGLAYTTVTAFFSAFVILLAILTTSIIQVKKWEDIWYDGRAIAESVKTLIWKFSMCSEPFDVAEHDAEERLKVLLRTMLNKRTGSLNSLLQSKIEQIIPKENKEIRKWGWQEKLNFYLSNRVAEQRLWYQKKERINTERQDFWFWITISAQSLALIGFVVNGLCPDFIFKPAAILAVVSSSAIAWMQVKRFRELSRSYATAFIDILFIEQSATAVKSDDEVARFVSDSENAISREHTLWLARRDMI